MIHLEDLPNPQKRALDLVKEVAAGKELRPFLVGGPVRDLITGANLADAHLRAAARNLTPVTLELGGKSPAIIGPNARFDYAVDSIMLGKTARITTSTEIVEA